MALSTPRPLANPLSRVRRAIGITRLARVTGLDRTGVEVACAVRPRGHVLQVSNGKGTSFAEAARGAVLEAAELFAAETVPPGPGPLAFAVARDLLGGPALPVPARAVHCPPPGGRALSGPEARWTSNGMGAHRSRSAALLHALLEAIERDQLARALPHLWTRRAVAGRMIERRSLARAAPRSARLARRIEAGGFEVYLFDLVPAPRRGRAPLGLPVAGALLLDPSGGPVPVAAGYACALEPDLALRAALLEAAQSRLTDIHGAREDIAPMDPEAAAHLAALCRSVKASRRAADLPRLRAGRPAAAVAAVLDRLRRAGVPRVAAVDLAPPGLGIHVVKVLVPGLRLSELL